MYNVGFCATRRLLLSNFIVVVMVVLDESDLA